MAVGTTETRAPPTARITRAERVWDIALAVAAVGGFLITLGPATYNFLVALVLAGTPAVAVARVVRLVRRQVGLLSARPRAVAVAMNQILFWILVAIALTHALPDAQLGGARRPLAVALWVAAGLRIVLALFPARMPRPVTNVALLAGSVFVASQLLSAYVVPAHSPVSIADPLPGTWTVLQGGRSVLLNAHRPFKAQRDALDILKADGGRTFRGNKTDVNSYFAYGQPVLAPVSGRVVVAIDYLPDQEIGHLDRRHAAGNEVVIQFAPSRYLLFAHLKRTSLLVNLGETVTIGTPIGRVGNSGNSSQPHLHLEVLNRADLRQPGARTCPLVFANVTLDRGGKISRGVTVDPRRNDRITQTTTG